MILTMNADEMMFEMLMLKCKQTLKKIKIKNF